VLGGNHDTAPQSMSASTRAIENSRLADLGPVPYAPPTARAKPMNKSATRTLMARATTVFALAACLLAPAWVQAQSYAALDPRGSFPAVERVPLAPRLSSLADKRIAIVMSWPSGSGMDQVAKDVAASLVARHKVRSAQIKGRNTRYSEDDPALWEEMKKGADGYIYIGAASSSTTSYVFKWSTHLEQIGIPGGAAYFDQLETVRETTQAREGARLRGVAFSYPVETMDKARYDAAIEQTIGMLTNPLTATELATGTITPPPHPEIAATGSLADIQRIFHEKGFTDGLPIIPPTRESVAAMLKGTSHSPDEVVATAFVPEGLGVTVRQVAINAVMAGCLPEHMPVLLATIEAYQKFNLNSMLRSTNSFAFMQVVNGPIAKVLKMNSGVNAVGPGNQANAAMGRALRLFITNLGGGEAGVNIMAVIGANANYSFMFAENEDESPWEPLSVTHGFRNGENTLTFYSGGWAHSGNYGLGTELADVPPDLARYQLPSGAVLIISPQRAAALARDGMSKDDVRRFLEENATRPAREARAPDRPANAGVAGGATGAPVQVYRAGTIDVIVAGGDAAPMMQAWHMYRPHTVSIDKWR